MTIFIIIAAVLAAVAVLLAAWPLLRPRADAAGKPVGPARQAAGALALFVPVLAFVMYFNLSEWPWDGSGTVSPQRGGNEQAASLQQMAEQLEARLQRAQGDTDGWKMLGRTYVVMGDYGKALDAYRQAYVLTSGADVEAMLGYAEAQVLVDESQFGGEAGQLFDKALAAEPGNPKALWYAGLTAYRKQDLATARSHWAALQDLGGPPEIQQVLVERIADIDQQIGPPPADGAPAAQPVAVAASSASPPEQAAAAGGGIPLRIEVAPALAGKVPPDKTLFILARSGEGGPPLAAVRRSASELPLDVTLTDANAMIPGTSLAQVGSLALVARVSLTGRPIASSGDLYGEVRYDPASKGPIRLTIDRVVP